MKKTARDTTARQNCWWQIIVIQVLTALSLVCVLKAQAAPATMTADATLWQKLTDSHWVQDGQSTAPRVVYLFSDPQCTYCFAFRRAVVDDITTGAIQLRHIMVGLLTEKSHPQAATILGSHNPSQAYIMHHNALKTGGIAIDTEAVKSAGDKVTYNTHMMVPLRTISTPTMFYRDALGKVQVIYGFPDDVELARLRDIPIEEKATNHP